MFLILYKTLWSWLRFIFHKQVQKYDVIYSLCTFYLQIIDSLDTEIEVYKLFNLCNNILLLKMYFMKYQFESYSDWKINSDYFH